MKHYLKISKILVVALLIVPLLSTGRVVHAQAQPADDTTTRVGTCVITAITARVAANLAGSAAEYLPSGSVGGAVVLTSAGPATQASITAAAAAIDAAATAVSVPTTDKAANILLGGLFNVAASSASFQNLGKQQLDSLAYAIAQCTLNELTNNIVNWIKGGFNGEPSFAINLEALTEDVATGVVDEFLKDVRGLGLCKFNFLDNLGNDIATSPKRKKIKLKCPFPESATTFTSTQFYNDFNTLGWRGMQAALEDGGNEFSINVVTSAELAQRQSQAKTRNDQQLSWSNGFANLLDTDPTNCNYPEEVRNEVELGEDTFGDPVTSAQLKSYQKRYCPTTTPGKIIADSLTKAVGAEQDRIGLADNMNKIISALIGQLTKQAVKGIFRSANLALSSGGAGKAIGGGNTGTWGSIGTTPDGTQPVYSIPVPYVSTGDSDVASTTATITGDVIYPQVAGITWFEWSASEGNLLQGAPTAETTVNTPCYYTPGVAGEDPCFANASTQYSYTLSGLAPDTTYYFRAVGYAQNQRVYGAISSFKTAP